MADIELTSSENDRQIAAHKGLWRAEVLARLEAGGGGAGEVNLVWTASPTGGVIGNDTGDDATLTLADGTNAGLLSPAQFAKLALLSGTNTGDQTTITGNAGSATVLQTARTIGGASFNGSANIQTRAPIIAMLSGPAVTDAGTVGRKAWWRVAAAFTLTDTDVSFDCVTAPTGSTALADIEKNGVSIYSARPQIDAGEISSSTGVVGTLTTNPMSFAVGDIVGLWIDQIGSSVAGAGYSLSTSVKYG